MINYQNLFQAHELLKQRQDLAEVEGLTVKIRLDMANNYTYCNSGYKIIILIEIVINKI